MRERDRIFRVPSNTPPLDLSLWILSDPTTRGGLFQNDSNITVLLPVEDLASGDPRPTTSPLSDRASRHARKGPSLVGRPLDIWRR